MRNTKCRDGRPSYLIGNSLMQIWISQTGCFKDFQRSAFREFVIGELQQLPVLWFSAWKAIVIVILSDKWPFISFRNLYAFCPKNWQLAFVWKEWIIKSPQFLMFPCLKYNIATGETMFVWNEMSPCLIKVILLNRNWPFFRKI